EPAFDGGDGVRLLVPGDGAGGAGGDVEPDGLRIGREQRQALAPAPAREVLPVRAVGAAGVGRARRLDIGAGTFGELLEMRRRRRLWGRGGEVLRCRIGGAV